MQYKLQLLENNKLFIYAWFESMHTRFDMAMCVSLEWVDFYVLISEIENEVKELEKIANRFHPKSELSYVNEQAFLSEIAVSAELINILAICQHYNKITNGFFDISVYSEKKSDLTTKTFSINTEANSIRFSRDGILLDVSGFIKGFALDKVSAILEKYGIENALLNFGNSSVSGKGNHPFGIGWKVNLPSNNKEITLVNECLTTSGNTCITKWPIVNPLDGEIKKGDIISVITANAVLGEVLSKVAYIAPENELKAILKNLNGKIAQ